MKRSHQELIDFSFRYRPTTDSPDGILFRFLQSYRPLARRHLILKALRAFYLAAAQEKLSQLEPSQLEKRKKTEGLGADAPISYTLSFEFRLSYAGGLKLSGCPKASQKDLSRENFLSAMRAQEFIDFSLRYRPPADSADGVLCRYLLCFKSIERRHLILKALRAFYLMAAYGCLAEFERVAEVRELAQLLESTYAADADIPVISSLSLEISGVSFLGGFSDLPGDEDNDDGCPS